MISAPGETRERAIGALRPLRGGRCAVLRHGASIASGVSGGSAATSSFSGSTPSPGNSRPVRASRISEAVSVGAGISGPASQICAYRSSDRSMAATCFGTPPERLKCSASMMTKALDRFDRATMSAACASVRTPV